MSEMGLEAPQRPPVAFTGLRGELFGKLLGGYLLMLPTLGIYRFWLTTTKRRYYWQNTVIDGDPLEYAGDARQLLLGFLLALAFFLPVYIGLFVLSIQAGLVSIVGYVVLGSLFWFFMGYAQYRGRDFRLSRTLWRGVRFDQKGNAWAYAARRFLWTLLVIATAGLAYPFMSASLWRYRYSHTWFGDRQVSFTGTWKTVAGPFYRAYGAVIATAGLAWLTTLTGVYLLAGLMAALVVAVAGSAFLYWRSREASRMFSAVRLGVTRIEARIKARWLFGQYTVYSLVMLVLLVAVSLGIAAIVMEFHSVTGRMPPTDFKSLAYTGWGGAALVVGTYAIMIGSFSLFSELILDFGYWKVLMRGASIVAVETLRDVRAIDEDKALLGEGLADALNVGAF